MHCKANDWIEHSAFGLGRVREDRGDRLDIQFVDSGVKTILKTAEFRHALSPPDFKFPRKKGKSRIPQREEERPVSRPRLDFDYHVSCFLNHFAEGFEGQGFDIAEREDKGTAAGVLKDKLGKDAFEGFLCDRHYGEVCAIAKSVLQGTNLVFPIEKAKFVDGIDNAANQERFANALYDLLHGSSDMEGRFTKFCGLLEEMRASTWPIATYYQFLATDGRWMFMRPSIMKRMADSLKMSLESKSEPNWLTYSKLQELADRVDLELQNRGLKPRSRIDVQGFIWTCIQIEGGNYGSNENEVKRPVRP
jgi:hypothetical protein